MSIRKLTGTFFADLYTASAGPWGPFLLLYTRYAAPRWLFKAVLLNIYGPVRPYRRENPELIPGELLCYHRVLAALIVRTIG